MRESSITPKVSLPSSLSAPLPKKNYPITSLNAGNSYYFTLILPPKSALSILLLHAPLAEEGEAPPRGVGRAAPVPRRVRGVALALRLADVEAEEHRGDEDGRPAAPGEAEGVGAQLCLAALVLEVVLGLDEDDTIYISSLAVFFFGGEGMDFVNCREKKKLTS